MDWIDEQLLNIKSKLQMKSLKKVLGIYILGGVILGTMLYGLTNIYCNSWIRMVYGKYGIDLRETMPLEELVVVDAGDVWLLKILNAIQTYSIIFYSILAIVIITNLFYKNKMETPIRILKEGANRMGRKDFTMLEEYKSGDEFGELCLAFEKMRLQLIRSEEITRSLMEGQRLLNATFAHDIRTPLTVLQGYTDMLIRYYPKGKISEEKLMDTMALMQEQLIRLKGFSETMKGLQDLESLAVNPQEKLFSVLVEQLKRNSKGIMKQKPIEILVHNKIKENSKGYYDLAVILQVVDNLLANGCSFANKTVEMILELDKNNLNIYISDDGIGFSNQELYIALNPYYSSRSQTKGHFGIGLTICKLLCEKHGGRIILSNGIKQGAIVCASFRIT